MNYLAGKTNSPIPVPRGYPRNIIGGYGPYVIDIDNKKYIDLWMGYGALLFGHADKELLRIIQKQSKSGWFFSYPTIIEKRIAELLHSIIPSAEVVRFATTGSDAVAYAIRAARAFTGRQGVLAIFGGYHGVHEGMMPSKGTLDLPKKVDLIKFNDISQARFFLKTRKYACLILEPILANSGCTPPVDNYLQKLREICTETNTVLIFDEIVTGFRISLGGAQSLFKVLPDISLFSKAIASGLPLSAICGKKVIMEHFIPTGEVFFAGTYNGNPLALAVAEKVIQKLHRSNHYIELENMGNDLRLYTQKVITELDLNACVQGIGSMFTIAFGCKEFRSGLKEGVYDESKYKYFVIEMAKRGILFPPLPTETIFLSRVHKPILKDIKRNISIVLKKMAKL